MRAFDYTFRAKAFREVQDDGYAAARRFIARIQSRAAVTLRFVRSW